MTELSEDTDIKMKRSLPQEFVRLESDFDDTRLLRRQLTDKLVQNASKVVLLTEGPEGSPEACSTREDTDTAVRLIKAAMDALSDIEKASTQVVNLKLKQKEQEIASSAATKDRIATVLMATQPGRIQEAFPAQALEEHLAELFDNKIQAFELKTNPRSLDETDIT